MTWDVIVVGGGTAGAAAAIAAGRTGAKTLVVEQLGSLGGTQSNGWVTPMMPNYIGPFKLSRGVNLDILAEQSSLQPGMEMEHGDEWYDPTLLALVLDRMAEDAGVECLFNASVIGAKREHNRVTEITVSARGGPLNLKGLTFVDSTGDAELSALAGAELMGGNEDGVHQPMTLRFTMGGIDLERATPSLAPHLRLNRNGYLEAGFGEAKDGSMGDLVRGAVDKGILEKDDLGYFQFFTVNGRHGELAFNAPRINGLDPLNPFEMSKAYQVGRAKIFRIANFMRATFDGFEHAFISVIAPLMGIRESRRVVGEYILTEEDHLGCVKFPDAIARNRYPIDIHLKSGIDYRKFPPGEYHDVPYGSIVVKGFENLWVAGRCLSATFVAQSAVRIQPVCRAMGEAAGISAALCARSGLTAQALPYAQLAPHLDLSVPETSSFTG